MGGRGVEGGQHAGTGGKPQGCAERQRQQGQGGGFLQQTEPELPGRGADAGKDAQLVQPCLHGDGKGVADQQHQRQRHRAQHGQIKGHQQGRGGILRIVDQIAGKQQFVGLYCLVGQRQRLPDAVQVRISVPQIPEGQVDHGDAVLR